MDKVLKQRLVGAAILIALAVIFVPMLFDGGQEREPRRDTALDLPPPPSDRREVRRLPLDPGRVAEERPAEPVDPAEPAEEDEIALLAPETGDRPAPSPEADPEPELPAVAEPVPEPAPDAEVLDEAVVEAEPDESEPAADPPAPEAPTLPDPVEPTAGDWVVQVASFSSAETADQVVDQLQRLGHAAGMDILDRGETRLHRLRTGPYSDRAAAERARSQIAATVAGVEPAVRQLPGDASESPRPEESGFAVQVGSFAQRANAERQLEQLTAQGYEAFIHPDESGSRAIWRVRAGLFEQRDQAIALQRELLEQAGLEGLVVSHP